MITALQTPPERFDNLPDYPFTPKFYQLDNGLKMHYVDEGPAEAPAVLLLHGEPSWSYLYRKMIPIFVQNGFRAIAPDLIGFGKSDKPKEKSDYTYQAHLNWLTQLVGQLGIADLTLFCQDWGGLLGLRIAMNHPDWFSRIVVANTFLPTGQMEPPEAFLQWQNFSQNAPHFPIGKVIDMATTSELSEEVIAAYDAPFPDESFKAGARVFPILVPTKADDPEAINNRAAWQKLKEWTKPLLTLFSDSDPIMKGGEKLFQKLVPGAEGQAHTIIEQAGHFLQEDQGETIAEHVVTFMKQNAR